MINILSDRVRTMRGLFLLFLLVSGTRAWSGDSAIPIEGGRFAPPKFRASVSLTEGYDDNSTTAHTDKVASGFTSVQANLATNLKTPRTSLSIGLGVGANYYYSRPGSKVDKNASLTLGWTYLVNPRLTLTLASSFVYQVQPDFTLLVNQNRISGQYFYTANSLSAAYQWTRRFSTVTSYQMVGIFYEDSISKLANDYISQSFSNQFRFLLSPTTTVVAQYSLGLVNYLYQTANNSLSNTVSGGFDHTFSPRLSMNLRVGGSVQSQSQGGSSFSPYADGSFTYAYRRLSNITGSLHYGFDYSNLAVNQTDKALRLGFQINHGFTPKLGAYLGAFYVHDDFSQASGAQGFVQDTFDITTGLRYTLSPRLSFQLGYTRTQLISNNTAQEYDRNLVTFGATYSF